MECCCSSLGITFKAASEFDSFGRAVVSEACFDPEPKVATAEEGCWAFADL